MVAFAFGGLTVTSWGPTTDQGHVWRARSNGRMVEFFADRDAPIEDLHRLGSEAIGDAGAPSATNAKAGQHNPRENSDDVQS